MASSRALWTFAGSAVYFVRQDEIGDIGEDGAFADNKLMFLLVVDHGADHVCRKQVGCELDAAEFAWMAVPMT